MNVSLLCFLSVPINLPPLGGPGTLPQGQEFGAYTTMPGGLTLLSSSPGARCLIHSGVTGPSAELGLLELAKRV